MTLKVEFYTNFVCPWCLIGERRLDNVVAGNSAITLSMSGTTRSG